MHAGKPELQIMIRKAKPADVRKVVPLLILAMGDLAAKFSNSKDAATTNSLFEHFFLEKDNQYSYTNFLVYEENGQVYGALNAYDGGKLTELRQNFLEYLSAHNGLKDFNPEPETQAGEFYFDTLAVDPEMQGKGIGKQLIDAGIEWADEFGIKKVGLLVDVNNDKALKLYKNKGFEVANDTSFIGGTYHHMVFNIITSSCS